MKILKISGIVVAIHAALFLLIFTIPGCHSTGSAASSGTPPAKVVIADASAPAAPSAPPVSSGFDPNAPAVHQYLPVQPGTAAAIALAPPPPPAPPVVVAAPEPPPPAAAATTTHKVTNGESLWAIAQKNHVTVAALAKANNIAVTAVLHAGQTLKIPATAATDLSTPSKNTPPPTDLATTTATTTGGDATTHKVKAGEVLSSIAKSYGVKLSDLEVANHITNPNKPIQVGQILKIPAKSASGKTAASDPTPAPATTPVEMQFAPLPTFNSSAPTINRAPPPPATTPPASPVPPSSTTPVIQVDDSGAPPIK